MKLVSVVVSLLLISTVLGRTYNIGEQCTLDCAKRHIPKIPEECNLYYKKGEKYSSCSWNTTLNVCQHKCSSGASRCHKSCSSKQCYGKTEQICQKKCTTGSQCITECIYGKYKTCYFDRIPGNIISKCRFIFQNEKFKNCLRNCVEVVKVQDESGSRSPNMTISYKYVAKLELNKEKEEKQQWQIQWLPVKHGELMVRKRLAKCTGKETVETVTFKEGDNLSFKGKCVTIMSAKYGAENKWMQVEKLLQGWVNWETNLINQPFSMESLFGDPFVGRKKILQVKYSFRT